MKKGFFKYLSVVKEVCQAFDLLVSKAIKFTEAFKYAIILVRLAVATPNSTLYQPDKAGLRNYVINLSKRSSHEYPRDVRWVVDGMAADRSVPPRATFQEWFKTLVTFITLSAKAWSKSVVIMEKCAKLSVQTWNKEFFIAGEVSLNNDTSIKISFIIHEREAPKRKPSENFTSRYS